MSITFHRFVQQVWDPISPQQRHGGSIVEVYRIIEETVDQFFGLKVPMRAEELYSLLRGLDNSFEIYTNLVTTDLVSKLDLMPPVPALTRYKKENVIKAFTKKETSIEPRPLDDRRSSGINSLTTVKLCVRLNSIYYALTHLNRLEDSIYERWSIKKKDYINISISPIYFNYNNLILR
jgi:hypothetical protein